MLLRTSLQCFDTVGLASGTASGLYKKISLQQTPKRYLDRSVGELWRPWKTWLVKKRQVCVSLVGGSNRRVEAPAHGASGT